MNSYFDVTSHIKAAYHYCPNQLGCVWLPRPVRVRLAALKKYTHVYLWTHDRTAVVKSIFCTPAGGTCQLTSLPKLATLVLLPFLLALDLIIIIRP